MKRTALIMLALALLCLAASALAETEIYVSSVTATSWIVGKDPTSYVPQRMLDGDETTSFQFSAKTTPLGQAYIYFSFAAPARVDTLWIKNGFWRVSNGLDLYPRNARVKAMTVDFQYAGSYGYSTPQTVTLNDDTYRYDWTRISLGGRQNVTGVRFLIRDIYYGSKYPTDVCISEVRFYGSGGGSYGPTAAPGGLYGLAIDRLSTRSGPGTQYTEKGTYNVKGEYIRVLSRAWDSINGIWWVKCEIPYHGELRVLWTGYKRFDSSTLPLDHIPLESSGLPPVTAPPVTAAPVTAPPSGGGGSTTDTWRAVYRSLIASGQYRSMLQCANSAYATLFAQRFSNGATEFFAVRDLSGDGVPELLVLTDYAIEQADVFTCQGNAVVRVGAIGGDNFFQDFFYFTGTKYTALYTAMGGPVMNIDAYTVSGGQLKRQRVAQTAVNSEGDTTTGIHMAINDNELCTLLYYTFVTSQNPSTSMAWYSQSQILSMLQ